MGPYRYRHGLRVSFYNKFECPSYTCGDAREDARRALQSGNPMMCQIDIAGTISPKEAVSFGRGFQKFVGVIASFPQGDIFSLPPEGGNVYYPTGQSAFHNS